MCGARMRVYSLDGTRPANTSRSVPRLMAPWRARTVTSSGPGAGTASRRISARPGPTDHSASASSPNRPLATRASRIGLETPAPAISWCGRKRQRGRGVTERGIAVDLVPAGSGLSLTGRRVLFATLVIGTIVGVLGLSAVALAPDGFDSLDLLILVLFAATLPWSVIGFWNATIGFLIMRLARDPIATVLPAARKVSGKEPITASTAILLCIRNEIPERVARNLEPMMADLVTAGAGERFHVYVLSDTDQAATAAEEELSFGGLAKK